MSSNRLGVMEERFADIIWDNAPILSGELVKLAECTSQQKLDTSATFFDHGKVLY